MIPRIAFEDVESMRGQAEAYGQIGELCQLLSELMGDDLTDAEVARRDVYLRLLQEWETVVLRYAEDRLRKGVGYAKAKRGV